MATVLVVDDSATDRRLAAALLKKLPDVTVYEAADGREAMQALERHLPEVVVTDIQMPRMNGIELVAYVKEHYPLIPIVLMTSHGSEEMAVEALQKGASSYVPKRALASDLVETIDRVLSASQEVRGRTRLASRLIHSENSFVIENDLDLICAVTAHLREEALRLRLCSRAECLRLGVAIEEALLNAYYHGNLEISSALREHDHRAYHDLAARRVRESPYQERRIHVTARITPVQAIYSIRDEGLGFDPSKLPDPTDIANLERPCGRGLLLMRTFMDNVIYNDRGNEVTLFKLRQTASEPVED